MAAFLTELRHLNIHVWADGERLRCNAPAGMLTSELRDRIQQRKDDILVFLRSAEILMGQQRAIVPLQPQGKRTPIFAVAGHNGDVFCYRALAQHLGNDQPFYGLQPPGLDGNSEPLGRVEDLAVYFAEQIRAFRPDGPYIIVGFCIGSMIAFELARQLQQRDAIISMLALFGAAYPTSYRHLPYLWWRLRYLVKCVIKHLTEVAVARSGERRLYIAEKLRARGERSAAERLTSLDPVLIQKARVESMTLAAARHYTPGYYAGRVSLFVPSRKWVRSGAAPLRWRSVARDTEEYYGPQGCTADLMLLELHVPLFAELFRQCREKSG